jgi:hypothetical protein
MDDPAYLAMRSMGEDPGEGEDPDDAPPPDVDEAELAAEAAEVLAAQERLAAVTGRLGLTAALAAGTAEGWGRRGPGMPGSTGSFPGVYASRASGFGSGKPLDVAPGCLVLGQFAEEAAGDDDRYPGAGDDELAGAVAAWDRVEAYASSRKHAAVAELIRRRPAAGCTPQGPAQMPEAFDEFTPREVASVLGETRGVAEDTLSLAHELEVNLPGTRAAFRSGLLNQRKAAIIAAATALLDPAEARAAEAKILDRAGALTPPALRAAIQRAVMQVAPGKARQRREHAAKQTRVERWAKDAVGHGCARPASRRKPGGPAPPGFTFTRTDLPGPPGGYGTWRLTTGHQDLLIKIGPFPAGDCDHRHQAKGHDPGVMLRHLAEVRHATCTGPGCRRPAARCDFEHNTPYEAGGRTCLCNGNPKCRHDHRLKQHPRWNAEQLPGGYVRWTAPSGRQYTTEPTRYPV